MEISGTSTISELKSFSRLGAYFLRVASCDTYMCRSCSGALPGTVAAVSPTAAYAPYTAATVEGVLSSANKTISHHGELPYGKMIHIPHVKCSK